MSDLSHVGEARRFALVMCSAQDFDATHSGRVGIIINELGTNLVKYASSGCLILRITTSGGGPGVEILSVDSGPGLESTARVLTDGFTTGQTPGTGLGAVKRQSSAFDIYSIKGQGTVVYSVVYAHDGNRASFYEVGAVSLPARGEIVCGDAWAAVEHGGRISAIVVDGLGHGPQASLAAEEAVAAFRAGVSLPLDQLMQSLHKRLKSTRGAAVFLIDTHDAGEVAFTGAGNIRAIIQTAGRSKTLISQNGTAGVQIRSVKPMVQEWNADGFLILHSDGIISRWDFSPYPGIMLRHPAIVAAVISRDCVRGADDATIMVIGRRR